MSARESEKASPLSEREKKKILELIEKHKDSDKIIALLLEVQREQGHLSEEVLRIISKQTGVSLSHLYGMATFYAQFSLHPRGKHLIRVCQGTACHVQGASQVAEAVKQELGIEEGETTRDRMFTLEYVNCLGCCSLAPVAVLDGSKVYAGIDPRKMRRVIRSLRKEGRKKK